MALLDFILNIVALLLWLNALSIHSDPLAKGPATLGSTLRRAQAQSEMRWKYLGTLAFILFIRAVVYWQISSALRWTPRLDLGIIKPFFYVDSSWRILYMSRMMVFSILSFAVVL